MPLPAIVFNDSLDHSGYFGAAQWACDSLTPAAAWRGALNTVEAHHRGASTGLAKVMVAGEIVAGREAMPRTDGSEDFEQWFGRVAGASEPGASILFYARDLPRYDRTLYEILLSASGVVFDKFGLSRREVDIELFCGDYRVTPGGIHREYCANNHFVLAGKKNMHFWTDGDWIPPDAERKGAGGPVGDAEEEYLPEVALDAAAPYGTALPATGGEVFNWSNGVWHVGETDGLALAINLARYMSSFDADEPAFFLAATDAGQVTAEWLAAYRSFLAVRTDAAEALAIASGFGIPGADPVRTAAPCRRVRSVTHAPVLWCAADDGALVATHGRAQRFDRTVLGWLDEVGRLPVGAECRVPAGTETERLACWLVANSALEAA